MWTSGQQYLSLHRLSWTGAGGSAGLLEGSVLPHSQRTITGVGGAVGFNTKHEPSVKMRISEAPQNLFCF